MTEPGWRAERPVLVVEAQSMGGIAVIRSLGRAGYPVHACATSPDALGLRSSYAFRSVVCPRYWAREFLPWLSDYVAQHDVRAIIPSEDFLLAIRPHLSDFLPLLPVNQQADVLYRGLSKVDVFQVLTRVGAEERLAAHVPPSLVASAAAGVPDETRLARLGAPLYIKVDSCYGTGDAEGAVYKARTAAEASARLAEIMSRYEKALVQGHVPGQGVGGFFLVWNGTVRAEFMHRRLHEVPPAGGVSSLRASWWHQAIRDDALAKLKALGWEGVAMMEYRWEPTTDRFHFIELNGRFWGSLHLALFAGVDFPVLLLDSVFGNPPATLPRFPLHLRCRDTFPKEVQYVWSRLKEPSVSAWRRAWAVLEFFLLSLDPTVKSDLMFPGDRRLYWERLWRFLTTLA